MADMWSVRPWQHELSDALTSPPYVVSKVPFNKPMLPLVRLLYGPSGVDRPRKGVVG